MKNLDRKDTIAISGGNPVMAGIGTYGTVGSAIVVTPALMEIGSDLGESTYYYFHPDNEILGQMEFTHNDFFLVMDEDGEVYHDIPSAE